MEAAVAVETRLRAERTRDAWTTMEAILHGTLDARPLVQMAGPAVHDVHWPGLPMALNSKAVVVESGESSDALQAVARVEREEWRKGSRKSREHQVERALSPVWVATAMVKRSARMLAHLDGGELTSRRSRASAFWLRSFRRRGR